MISGGIAIEGPGGSESTSVLPPSQCRYQDKVIKTGDFNFDGREDKVIAKQPGSESECIGHLKTTVLFIKGEEDLRHLPLPIEQVLGPDFSFKGAKRFSYFSDSIIVAAKKGGPTFKINDRVNAPFGPVSNKKVKGRIVDFLLEFDPKWRYVRTLAKIETPYGIDFFELSALTLIMGDPPYVHPAGMVGEMF